MKELIGIFIFILIFLIGIIVSNWNKIGIYIIISLIVITLLTIIITILILIKKRKKIKIRQTNKKYLLEDQNKKNLSENKNITLSENKKYNKKDLLTPIESKFYKILKENFKEYDIIPQINLATIIKKESIDKFQNELYRNIDFGIFKNNKILLLIEINDKTHNDKKRQYRDIKVKKICEEAKIKLITFYTNLPNEKNYIINRISKNLKDNL